jgi:hypothetical protein
VIDVLMVAVLAVAWIYATVLWRRRRGRLEQIGERATARLYEREAERRTKPKPIARARERSWPVACRGATRHCDARLRSRPGVQWHERKTIPTWRARSAKKSSRADDPAPKTPTQRYAYASKLLGDRDGGDFAPACSSQDLDCVGRRRCSPLGPAGGTLAHPACFVIKVKTSRKPVKSLAGRYGAAWPQQRR